MPEIRLELPRPHPGQRRILPAMSRYNVVCCGRRFGKSTLGLIRAAEIILAGGRFGWFAPTYKDLAESWRDVKRFLKPITTGSNKSDWRMEFMTGGSIEFWSLKNNPDAGRSRKYHRVLVDEAAKATNLSIAWPEAIRPTLADYGGDADFYSTPKGINYFHGLATQGMDPLDPEWSYFHAPTSANPYIAKSEVENLRRSLPERTFSQEVLAVFLADGGGVFRGVSGCVDVGRTANTPPVRGLVYSQGTDLARKVDFTVNTTLDPGGSQVYWDRFNQISWERQIESIAASSRTYNRATVTMDSTGVGDPIFEACRKKDMGPVKGFQFTHASKGQLIDNLAIMIETGKIRLMDHPIQTAELVAYEYEITKGGHVTTCAPDGGHDDTVMGLALAAWGSKGVRTRGFL